MAGKLDIKLGQRWVTRSGAIVTVVVDRYERFPANGWRWALTNDQIADEAGRVSMAGLPHDSDLMTLYSEPDVVKLSNASIQGMDSTMGSLE
jgi:hypothetical protein